MIIRSVGLVVFVAIIYGPLIALLPETLRAIVAGNAGGMIDGRQFWLLAHSVGLAVGVAAGCTLLGVPIATVLWQCKRGPLSRARWLVLALALIPPYIHAQVWQTLGAGIYALLAFGNTSLWFWASSLLVPVMALTPLTAGLTLLGLEMIDPKLIEAARTLRSDARVLAE